VGTAEKPKAGPSTTLRYGRDDNSFASESSFSLMICCRAECEKCGLRVCYPGSIARLSGRRRWQ